MSNTVDHVDENSADGRDVARRRPRRARHRALQAVGLVSIVLASAATGTAGPATAEEPVDAPTAAGQTCSGWNAFPHNNVPGTSYTQPDMGKFRACYSAYQGNIVVDFVEVAWLESCIGNSCLMPGYRYTYTAHINYGNGTPPTYQDEHIHYQSPHPDDNGVTFFWNSTRLYPVNRTGSYKATVWVSQEGQCNVYGLERPCPAQSWAAVNISLK